MEEHDRKEFYDRMRKGEVSGTAQIPVSELIERFESYAKDGTPTVYLGFSSALSGTYGTVEQVAEDIRAQYPDFELYTIDTKLASIAEGCSLTRPPPAQRGSRPSSPRNGT